MYVDIDMAGRMSIFEMRPEEVKILAEGLGHLIDAATTLRVLCGGQEFTIRKAEQMLRMIREQQL